MSSEEELLDLVRRVPTLSYFKILGLPHRYAPPAEVKKAFHAFAQLFHPDLYQDSGEPIQQAAKEAFKRAVEAYEALRDEQLQRHYVEDFLKKGQLRLPPNETGRRPDPPKAAPARPKPRPQAPPQPRTWAEQMATEDGREVAQRIERMIDEGRYQAALQQMALLTSIEGKTEAVLHKEAYLRRMVERARLTAGG